MRMRNVNELRAINGSLTMDQIRNVAPSAFALTPCQNVSARYTFIPTSNVIEGLMANGFQPVHVAQSRTRIPGKQPFARHMIRFRQANSTTMTRVGDETPEVVLINGHDLSTSYKLMGGIFRLVCSNGMVIADSMVGTVHIRHQGNIIEQVTNASMELIRRMPVVTAAIALWKSIQLAGPQQLALAEAAHTVRFGDAEGHVNTPIRAEQLLDVRRPEDNRNDLWSVFNRVQENVLRGGLSARPDQGRKVTTQAVRAIERDVKLNQALWTLGERMAELVS